MTKPMPKDPDKLRRTWKRLAEDQRQAHQEAAPLMSELWARTLQQADREDAGLFHQMWNDDPPPQ